mgnify:CR=1 FL=1
MWERADAYSAETRDVVFIFVISQKWSKLRAESSVYIHNHIQQHLPIWGGISDSFSQTAASEVSCKEFRGPTLRYCLKYRSFIHTHNHLFFSAINPFPITLYSKTRFHYESAKSIYLVCKFSHTYVSRLKRMPREPHHLPLAIAVLRMRISQSLSPSQTLYWKR